jgi:hypothetical protein
MLSSTCVLWANTIPAVSSPPGAPGWWNQECIYYAYGWWSSDIIGGGGVVSPPHDESHWASNYLENTDFKASIGIANQTIAVDLNNVLRRDLHKQIYVYITGTTNTTTESIVADVNTDSGKFYGHQTWTIGENSQWNFVLEGEIYPQPSFASVTFNVPGMTGVTNIWAGENCVPEPATLTLLGLGVLSLLRRKRSV